MVAVITAGQAILKAIIDEPDVMLHRMAYADWLEENDRPERAGLIRVQLELASLPAYHFSCPAACRERDLLFGHWPRWLHDAFNGLAHDVGVSARDDNDFGVSLYDAHKGELGHLDCRFRRGFVEEVTLPLQVWLDHGPALVRAHPLRKVVLSDRRPACWLSCDVDEVWRWLWAEEGWDTTDSHLPPDLWVAVHDAGGTGNTYASLEGAGHALSLGCLAWARATPVA